MAGEALNHAWNSLRVRDIPSALKRILGLAEHSDADFALKPTATELSALQAISRKIRGEMPPAVFVHGVLPRSGTNYAANLLALHPDINAFPRDMWEIPTLATTPASLAWRHEWLARFPENEPIVGRFEPLCWTANGMLRALQTEAPTKHMLCKSPHMRHASLFDAICPDDTLVMVVRDGRDVIASSRGTFKDRLLSKNFRQLTTEWRQATELALELAAAGQPKRLLWRFEDLVADPEAILRRDLPKIGLDPDKFPYAELSQMPVFGSSTDQREGNDRWNPVEKKAAFNPVGRGQTLPQGKLAAFARAAGPTMAKAGYT